MGELWLIEMGKAEVEAAAEAAAAAAEAVHTLSMENKYRVQKITLKFK